MMRFWKTRLSIGAVIVLVLATILVTFQTTFLIVSNRYNRKLNQLELADNTYSKLAAVDELYRNYYIYDVDDEAVSDAILYGYVAGTGDRYGQYLSREDFQEYMDDRGGTMVGIGAHVNYNYDYQAIELLGIMPNSPALEAGLEAGDLIVGVNGKDVSELGYYGTIAAVRGEEGTEVELTIWHPGSDGKYSAKKVSVRRAAVDNETVLCHLYAGKSDKKIGIVTILEFDSVTTEQFTDAVEKMKEQGAEAFVFDVRDNPGGNLDVISAILDMLLPEGPIIRIHYKSGEEEVLSSDAACLDMPMAVLVNGNTASAAELFSSAIQDYGLGTLVGTQTYGKGTMQTTLSLGDGSALVLSVAHYDPPVSGNYDGVGVTPDVVVELSKESAVTNRFKRADTADEQLQAAIAVLND